MAGPDIRSLKPEIVQCVVATVREFSMLRTGDKVVVAVSGGPDSVALLYILRSIRDEFGFSLHVAHLNHSFRAEDSDRDAEFVCELAENLSLPCSVEKIDVPAIRETLRLSVEEAARLVRYEFLERTAEQVGADRIALGHTADDQVETVLMNIVRGTGVDGLGGMPPVRGRIVRPLIRVRRCDVETYLDALQVEARVDESNLLPVYTRNRIRLQVLPMLREVNPEVDSAILRLSELARSDAAYITEEARETLARLVLRREDGLVSVDAMLLAREDPAIQRRAIREVVKELRGELVDIGYRHIEELQQLLSRGTGFRYEFPGGVFAERSGDELALHSERPSDIPIIYKHEIDVPGVTSIAEVALAIDACVVGRRVDVPREARNMEVVLDYEKIHGTLIARNWHPGDRIRPLGMVGSKKLQDVFTDRKIPRQARHLMPVVQDDEQIVWVTGLVVSELVKVTDATRVFLHLRALPFEVAKRGT